MNVLRFFVVFNALMLVVNVARGAPWWIVTLSALGAIMPLAACVLDAPCARDVP